MLIDARANAANVGGQAIAVQERVISLGIFATFLVFGGAAALVNLIVGRSLYTSPSLTPYWVAVMIGSASGLLVNRAREDNAWVVHTVEVESRIANLLVEVRRAESATRAYMLTSAPQYLTEYQSANHGDTEWTPYLGAKSRAERQWYPG